MTTLGAIWVPIKLIADFNFSHSVSSENVNDSVCGFVFSTYHKSKTERELLVSLTFNLNLVILIAMLIAGGWHYFIFMLSS